MYVTIHCTCTWREKINGSPTLIKKGYLNRNGVLVKNDLENWLADSEKELAARDSGNDCVVSSCQDKDVGVSLIKSWVLNSSQ